MAEPKRNAMDEILKLEKIAIEKLKAIKTVRAEGNHSILKAEST